METLKQFHGLPCNCYTRRVLLGLLPDPNADSCPSLCGTDVEIIGISNAYTVDGWYLQFDDSNLAYMESGVITETVPCESGLADFIITSGSVTAAPAVYHNDSWSALIIVDLKNQNIGVDFSITTQTDDWFTNELIGDCQISTDGGITWVSVGAITNGQLTSGAEVTFNTTETDYIYRVVVTDTVTGCQFFNPAPDTGSPSYWIYYATIDMNADVLFSIFGSINSITPLDGDPAVVWVDILNTMVAPYQSVAGRLGGIGIDYSLVNGGAVFEAPFYLQIITPSATPPVELAVILDSVGTPVDTSPQGTANVIKNYVGTYNFVDLNDTQIQGFKIFGANVRFNEINVINPATEQYVVHAMEDYQIADSAFTFAIEINATNVQFFITTAVPITDVLIEDTSVNYVVPLIEI